MIFLQKKNKHIKYSPCSIWLIIISIISLFTIIQTQPSKMLSYLCRIAVVTLLSWCGEKKKEHEKMDFIWFQKKCSTVSAMVMRASAMDMMASDIDVYFHLSEVHNALSLECGSKYGRIYTRWISSPVRKTAILIKWFNWIWCIESWTYNIYIYYVYNILYILYTLYILYIIYIIYMRIYIIYIIYYIIYIYIIYIIYIYHTYIIRLQFII